jgi:hypothetical protein
VSLAQRAGSVVGSRVPGLTAATLTSPLERFLQRHSRERQPLSWKQRRELLPRFESDIELLERVLGEGFRDWVRPRERSGGMVGARPAGQGQARNGRRAQGPAATGGQADPAATGGQAGPAAAGGQAGRDPETKDLSEAR